VIKAKLMNYMLLLFASCGVVVNCCCSAGRGVRAS